MLNEQIASELGNDLQAITVGAIQTVNYNGYGPANATGKTAASIYWRQTKAGIDIMGPDYVLTLVHGRGPTVANGNGVLRAKIREWLDAKGIGEPDKRNSISYAVTRNIHKKGTTLYQKGGNSPIFDALVSEPVQELIARAAKTNFINQIKGWAR
jgi:hypothetical protein